MSETLDRPIATAHCPARPEISKEQANLIACEAAHADGRLYDVLAELRRTEPLGLARPDGFNPFWVVTRQAALRKITMNRDDFLTSVNSAFMSIAASEQMRKMLKGDKFPVEIMLYMDEPKHTTYRAVAADFFHARNLDRIADQIRTIAGQFVDHMLTFDGMCDFARDVAHLYPLRVIMQLMGVPVEDEPLMLRLSQEFGGGADEDLIRAGKTPGQVAVGQSMVEVAAESGVYFTKMMADRRADPRNDIVSVIANALIDGEPMPEPEARGFCFSVATAGHETTAGVTAGGMLALCQNPGLIDEIRGDPEKIKAFVEEAIRMYAPIKFGIRCAAKDMEIDGRQIRAGDMINLAFCSGNRDEAIFDDPDVFRIDRKPNKHISFGAGPHVCLGQHLARLEMRLFFEELTSRIESVELAGEPRCVANLLMSPFKSIPIRFVPRK